MKKAALLEAMEICERWEMEVENSWAFFTILGIGDVWDETVDCIRCFLIYSLPIPWDIF